MYLLIINFLILLLYIVLFVLSRKTAVKLESKNKIEIIFYRAASYLSSYLKVSSNRDILRRQKLLHPTGRASELARNYQIKKLSEFMIIIFVGNLLAMVMVFNTGDSGKMLTDLRLARNSYGEGSRSETLDMAVDGKIIDSDTTIEISERRYTANELQKVFDAIKKGLPEIIQGENKSVDKVNHNLNLPKRYKNYPVDISWYSSDYNVMDSLGVIQEDFYEKEGAEIYLTASLDYYGEHDELNIPIRVFPREMTPEETVRLAISKALKASDMESISSDQMILPNEVEGKSLSYSHPKSRTAVYALIITIITAFTIFYLRDDEVKKAVEKREALMSEDYPEIVSRLTLLLSAGMTIRAAFEKTAADYEKDKVRGKCAERYAYEEMLVTVRQMKSGKSEISAYQDFGTRSASARFNKLGSLLSQNLKKGSAGLLNVLEYETKDAFEDRKAAARRKGEEAGTRLLLPMGMMLVIVLVIVVVPSVISFA